MSSSKLSRSDSNSNSSQDDRERELQFCDSVDLDVWGQVAEKVELPLWAERSDSRMFSWSLIDALIICCMCTSSDFHPWLPLYWAITTLLATPFRMKALFWHNRLFEMLDFCPIVQLFIMCSIFLRPKPWMLHASYSIACGPLMATAIIQRLPFIPHSFDKYYKIRTFILPSIVMYIVRWSAVTIESHPAMNIFTDRPVLFMDRYVGESPLAATSEIIFLQYHSRPVPWFVVPTWEMLFYQCGTVLIIWIVHRALNVLLTVFVLKMKPDQLNEFRLTMEQKFPHMRGEPEWKRHLFFFFHGLFLQIVCLLQPTLFFWALPGGPRGIIFRNVCIIIVRGATFFRRITVLKFSSVPHTEQKQTDGYHVDRAQPWSPKLKESVTPLGHTRELTDLEKGWVDDVKKFCTDRAEWLSEQWDEFTEWFDDFSDRIRGLKAFKKAFWSVYKTTKRLIMSLLPELQYLEDKVNEHIEQREER